MIRHAARHAAVAAPLATLALHGIPWWAAVIAFSLGSIAYIYRQYLLYRLASKALDKVPYARAAAVITAINGHSPSQPAVGDKTRGGQRNPP
jgi:hypothetical protein